MIVEVALALTSLLLYKKIKMKSLLGVSASLLLAIFTKLAVFPLVLSLAFLTCEIILQSAYKPLNNAGG